jgi:uncharacterized protein YegL
MKKRAFNLIIVDESGSMMSMKQAAIDSVNETLQTIRAAEKKHPELEQYVSLVTFNDDVKTINDCASATEVKELTNNSYSPNCCTALYDAIGMSVHKLKEKVAPSDCVLVTIVTDGYENASREYNDRHIKALIEDLKKQNWVFTYIGTDHDVTAVADNLSINNTMSFCKSEEGFEEMRVKENNCRNAFFSLYINKGFSKKLQEDFFSLDEAVGEEIDLDEKK